MCAKPEVLYYTIEQMQAVTVRFASNLDDEFSGVIAGYASYKKGLFFFTVECNLAIEAIYLKPFRASSKNTCPLNRNCLQSSVIYQATFKPHDTYTSETYIGLTENEFKTIYRNHIASFRHAKHRNSTKLGKHIELFKDSNIDHYFMAHYFIPLILQQLK